MENLILELDELELMLNTLRSDNIQQLEDSIKKSILSFILWREQNNDDQEFIDNNVLLTEALFNFVSRDAKGIPIVFSSTSKGSRR